MLTIRCRESGCNWDLQSTVSIPGSTAWVGLQLLLSIQKFPNNQNGKGCVQNPNNKEWGGWDQWRSEIGGGDSNRAEIGWGQWMDSAIVLELITENDESNYLEIAET